MVLLGALLVLVSLPVYDAYRRNHPLARENRIAGTVSIRDDKGTTGFACCAASRSRARETPDTCIQSERRQRRAHTADYITMLDLDRRPHRFESAACCHGELLSCSAALMRRDGRDRQLAKSRHHPYAPPPTSALIRGVRSWEPTRFS